MLKELYNKAYQKFTPDFLSNPIQLEKYLAGNRESLVSFIASHKEQFDYPTSDKTVLELGCGIGSLSFWLKEHYKNVTAVDVSDLAISIAQSIGAINESEDLKFLNHDALSLELGQKFDFVIDSHLFHCLPFKEQREKYLNTVKKHLKPDGWFLMEAMVMQDRLQVPVGYEFDEQNILYQEIEEEWIASRCILPSIKVEEEVAASGLKLNYFYYHHELSFQVFEDYPTYPPQFLPKTVRLSSRLK
ncbi:MAG: hypothetical protein CME65_04865 [Halobacteriovoraceae bacterium]|nr:hypothetical protein [Halobacteriovoraceae bacterium]|tara:strand:- start:5176 stop:5910 length:735 start_codon:yes stop_codon:yes gene_type:complete